MRVPVVGERPSPSAYSNDRLPIESTAAAAREPEPASAGIHLAEVTGTMLALPHVSGTECIEALTRFGYRAQKRRGGLASLHRDGTVVIVPENATLSPALVGAILRTADVDPLDFLLALDHAALRRDLM